MSQPRTNRPGPAQSAGDDEALLRALLNGDDRVFSELVDRWSGMMLRLALTHIKSQPIAEEIVQEAWLTVVHSLDRYERRSSLRTWVLGIVVNLARSRARAERRSILRSSTSDGSVVDPSRFLGADHPRWPHHWAAEPAVWRTPEDELLASETRDVLLHAIDALPAAQREVLVLRDLDGLNAAEACNILGLTDTHQRVLLHRARSRVRAALEGYFLHSRSATTEAT
jgi:RNA polymerase sigma-70 factor (ECF subfamily)